MTDSNDPTVVVHGRINPLIASHLNDAEVASGVFMYCSINPAYVGALMNPKTDTQRVLVALPHIARDRILFLSQRLERAEALLHTLVHDASDDTKDVLDKASAFLNEPKTVPSSEPDVMKRE